MKRKNDRQNRGITLIALIITIIILLILAGVAINMVLGNNGMFKQINASTDISKKINAREKVELALSEALIEKNNNEEYNENDFLNEILKKSVENIKILGDKVTVDGYEFEIDRKSLIIVDVKNEGIIGKINNINTSGIYAVTVNGRTVDEIEESETYSLHVVVYNGDMVLNGVNVYDGIELVDNVYEVGDKTKDVATESNDAKNTVILKVNGNLTINNNITLTACKSGQGYGGPKGMIIYCTGDVINNGTISMTARGARAVGQNVYLWENSDGTFEYVPAIGADGGASVLSNGKEKPIPGNAGTDAVIRQTGGGASGGAQNGDEAKSTYSGTGASGTSYSGGSGGGGCSHNSRGGIKYGGNAGKNGGTGGLGNGYRASTSWVNRKAGGGAGNPGGYSGLNGLGNAQEEKSDDGTGGLLVIYTKNIYNNGTIESNGSKAVDYGHVQGGSSGGGSINIFYQEANESTGSINANGGEAIGNYGACGGNGSISIGKIQEGTYKGE